MESLQDYMNEKNIVQDETYNTIKDSIICPIFKDLLITPMMWLNCKNSFCKKSLKNWSEINKIFQEQLLCKLLNEMDCSEEKISEASNYMIKNIDNSRIIVDIWLYFLNQLNLGIQIRSFLFNAWSNVSKLYS